jgi:aryl-alcohol dehydrogenase-like predicted oxidoreductase
MTMQYRTLPGTGVSVSNLALGAMGFGAETDEADAFAILDRFVEADGNLVDTANVYGGGASEEVIGRWFASRPAEVTERVVLATKARFGTGSDVNENGSSRRNLDRALNASLRRLGRDTIDLYQLHGWDALTPIEVTLSFLNDAVHAGKINHIGLSNFTGWQLQLTVSTAEALGFEVPVTLQPQYSLVSREIEYEIVPAAVHNDLGLLPWSPLAAGFLSGKYSKDEKAPSDTRGGAGNPMNDYIFGDLAAHAQNWATLDAVRDIAANNEVTPSQVAYSWVANRPGVIAPIIGAKTLDQLEQNLVAGDLVLSDEETARLDEVSAPTPNEYPYGPFGVKQRDRYVDSSDQAITELF